MYADVTRRWSTIQARGNGVRVGGVIEARVGQHWRKCRSGVNDLERPIEFVPTVHYSRTVFTLPPRISHFSRVPYESILYGVSLRSFLVGNVVKIPSNKSVPLFERKSGTQTPGE